MQHDDYTDRRHTMCHSNKQEKHLPQNSEVPGMFSRKRGMRYSIWIRPGVEVLSCHGVGVRYLEIRLIHWIFCFSTFKTENKSWPFKLTQWLYELKYLVGTKHMVRKMSLRHLLSLSCGYINTWWLCCHVTHTQHTFLELVSVSTKPRGSTFLSTCSSFLVHPGFRVM